MLKFTNNTAWIVTKADQEANCIVSAGGFYSCVKAEYEVNKSPASESEMLKGLLDSLQHYRESLSRYLRFSEHIFPELRCDLSSKYIAPRLRDAEENCSVTAEDVLHERRPFVVYGMPGAGKTSFLRWFGLSLLNRPERTKSRLPVYVGLRKWTPDYHFDDFVINRTWAEGSKDRPVPYYEQLKRGEIYFLLDGLDEVPVESRATIQNAIAHFMTKHHKCSFAISSRNPESIPLKQLRNIEIGSFSKQDVKLQVKSHLGDGSDAFMFWSKLVEEPELLQLSSNPLVLSLLLFQYQRYELSPHDVSSSLLKISRVLMDEWDAMRGVIRSHDSWLSPSRKLSILRRLSFQLLLKGKTNFSAEDFENMTDSLAGSRKTIKVIEMLHDQTGLISRNQKNQWIFAHSCYRDFFAASFLVERLTGIDYLTSINISPSTSKRLWRYIFGLTSDASEALTTIAGRGAGPSIDNAILLADALSQRLCIDKSAVDLASSYIVQAIRIAFRGSTPITGASAQGLSDRGQWNLTLLYPFERKDAQIMAKLSKDLIRSIFRASDGVGKDSILHKIAKSKDPRVNGLIDALQSGGQLNIEVCKTDEGYILSANKAL